MCEKICGCQVLTVSLLGLIFPSCRREHEGWRGGRHRGGRLHTAQPSRGQGQGPLSACVCGIQSGCLPVGYRPRCHAGPTRAGGGAALCSLYLHTEAPHWASQHQRHPHSSVSWWERVVGWGVCQCWGGKGGMESIRQCGISFKLTEFTGDVLQM